VADDPGAAAAPAKPVPPRRWRLALACAAGAALSAAFAPYGLWPLAVLAPAVLIALWAGARDAREGAALGFAFSLGTYAVGTWWLYIAIHVFGQASVWIAALVMVALVAIMAGYQALLGYLVLRFLPARSPFGWLVAVPAAWVLLEWWRGWFLSGFPWLSLGYSQTDTWLAGLAPVGGVHLVSAALLLSAGATVTLLHGDRAAKWIAAVLLLLPWTLGAGLRGVEWTRPAGPPVSIAILQGAVSQDLKWLESNRQSILDGYARLHREALGAQLILWPESALPDLANSLPRYLSGVWSSARAAGSAVLLGVMRHEPDSGLYYNALLALSGDEMAFYDKQHLVPFGEYFPVPSFVREWLRLMSLPYSDFEPGAARQAPLRVAGLSIAPSICYEDAYPGELLYAQRQADLLVNVTNDAWFGRSSARYQHLQIARMRAIETERYLLRAANDGVSAVIGRRGEIVVAAREYEPVVLRAMAEPRTGLTPYVRSGNSPVLAAAGLLLAAVAWRRQRSSRPAPPA